MTGKQFGWLLALGLTIGAAGVASAQDAAGGQPNQPPAQDQGNRGGGRGNFDPAQFRQRMEERMKEQLGASDDEWKVIQPRYEKVMQLRFQSMAGGGGGFFGRGGGGGGAPGGDRGGDRGNRGGGFGFGGDPNSPVAKAQADLKSGLEDKSISADEIAKRLAALRQAREQAKAELTKAQAELKEVLTQRQEAQLVLSNMLE